MPVERRGGSLASGLMGQRETGGAHWFRQKAAAFTGWHEPYNRVRPIAVLAARRWARPAPAALAKIGKRDRSPVSALL